MHRLAASRETSLFAAAPDASRLGSIGAARSSRSDTNLLGTMQRSMGSGPLANGSDDRTSFDRSFDRTLGLGSHSSAQAGLLGHSRLWGSSSFKSELDSFGQDAAAVDSLSAAAETAPGRGASMRRSSSAMVLDRDRVSAPLGRGGGGDALFPPQNLSEAQTAALRLSASLKVMRWHPPRIMCAPLPPQG